MTRPTLRHREPFSALAVLGVLVAAFWLTVGVACVVSVWHRAPLQALRWTRSGYRAEVGLAFMGALYIVGLILWLAWHGMGFIEFGAFGVTMKASEAEKVEATEAGLTGTKKQISTLENVVIDGLKELNVRVSELEKRRRPSDDS